jgi:hypothetical protein
VTLYDIGYKAVSIDSGQVNLVGYQVSLNDIPYSRRLSEKQSLKNKESDTPRRAGGLMSCAASKAAQFY